MNRKFEIKIQGKSFQIEVKKASGGQASILVDGEPLAVEYQEITAKPAPATAPAPAPSAPPPAPPKVSKAPAPAPGVAGAVTAPMSGMILEILVNPGAQVKAGDILVKLEAMKMENELPSPADGTVKEVKVTKGTHVEEGQVLLIIE